MDRVQHPEQQVLAEAVRAMEALGLRLRVLLRQAPDGGRRPAEGDVEFRHRFWAFPGDEPHLAPTLLVYADLLAIGDARCLETAQLLRGQLLARLA